MSEPNRLQQLASGPLSRWSGVVYWLVVVEVLIIVTAAPTVVLALLLERDVSNIPLYALSLVPLGPTLGAALFAWREFRKDPYPVPARHFWRGYRVSALDVLKLWLPLLVVLTILAMNVAHREIAGVPTWLAAGFGLIAVGFALWACNVVPIAALFSFRVRDTARLAAYYLAARPLNTLGWVSVLVLALGLVWYFSDWVLLLALSPLTLLAYRNAEPMVAELQLHFTPDAPDSAGDPAGEPGS